MNNKLLLVFTTIILASCQPIKMKLYEVEEKLYGIKDPDIENEKTITKMALKYDLDTSNIVTVYSEDFLFILNRQSYPSGSIYDKNGKYIEYKQVGTPRNADLLQFIPSLNLNDKYNRNSRYIRRADLNTELNKFRDLKGNILKQPESADFYLLIYWTVWTGKLNKTQVKIWEDLARDNNNCKIEVIKVNLDIQEYWDEQERDKIIERMSRMIGY